MSLLDDVRQLRQDMEAVTKLAARHEEQISGERGLLAALREVVEEMKGVKRAGYSIAIGIVLSSVGFGYAALQLVR